MNEKYILLDDINPLELWGTNDTNLKLIQINNPKVKIISRGNVIKLNGDESAIEKTAKLIEKLIQRVKKSGALDEDTLSNMLENKITPPKKEGEENDDVLVYGAYGKIIKARTANQKLLVEYTQKNDIVFAIGPAGTGKTYTAVACAVKALKNREVKKLFLCRPAVEAGESLGFLPGDMKEKIDPYLRPLYDALDDMFPPEKLKSMLETRVIEIAPMAFMRGRTLDNCYVLLDEAQNATDMQLKMFLTRLGPHGKMIITGDVTQIDLPKKEPSGLPKAIKLLKNVKGIKICELTIMDVVRHRLVKEIIKAYDNSAVKTDEK